MGQNFKIRRESSYETKYHIPYRFFSPSRSGPTTWPLHFRLLQVILTSVRPFDRISVSRYSIS